MAAIHAEIQRVLRVELNAAASVAPDDRLADCEELDSLGLFTLAVALEDRFRVKLAEEDAPGLETFADLAHLVVRRRGVPHDAEDGEAQA
jgi:acyl carrier protein